MCLDMSDTHMDIYALVYIHVHAYAHTNTTNPPQSPILLWTTSRLPASSNFLVHFPVFPLAGTSLPKGKELEQGWPQSSGLGASVSLCHLRRITQEQELGGPRPGLVPSRCASTVSFLLHPPRPLSPAATRIKPSERKTSAQVVHSWSLGSELVNSVLEQVARE